MVGFEPRVYQIESGFREGAARAELSETARERHAVSGAQAFEGRRIRHPLVGPRRATRAAFGPRDFEGDQFAAEEQAFRKLGAIRERYLDRRGILRMRVGATSDSQQEIRTSLRVIESRARPFRVFGAEGKFRPLERLDGCMAGRLLSSLHFGGKGRFLLDRDFDSLTRLPRDLRWRLGPTKARSDNGTGDEPWLPVGGEAVESRIEAILEGVPGTQRDMRDSGVSRGEELLGQSADLRLLPGGSRYREPQKTSVRSHAHRDRKPVDDLEPPGKVGSCLVDSKLDSSG